MKLTILVDNNTYIDQYLLGEPALSFYIEDGENKVLFDTGYSDAFIKNAKALGIDLSEITSVALSHGHVDHTGGIPYLAEEFETKNIPMYAHPKAFEEKRMDGVQTGAPLRAEEVEKLFDLRLSAEPVQITPNIMFMGQIPQYFDFESRVMTGYVLRDGEFVPDYDIDDTALVYTGKEGLYIITGCSHAGICNIVKYAQKLTGVEKIAGIIGGFHLFKVDDRLENTINYLESLNVSSFNPCHCVSLFARAEMLKRFPISETGTGMTLSVDE